MSDLVVPKALPSEVRWAGLTTTYNQGSPEQTTINVGFLVPGGEVGLCLTKQRDGCIGAGGSVSIPARLAPSAPDLTAVWSGRTKAQIRSSGLVEQELVPIEEAGTWAQTPQG